MTLSTLFDRIAGKQRERQQARDADFRALVTDIADGKDPDPDLVDHVLAGNQKNLDELRSAVELLLRRRELRETYDKAGRLSKERASIERKIVEADKLLEQAEIRHEEITSPLYGRIEAIKQANVAADRARRELWETCADPDLQNRLARVSQRFKELSEKHVQIKNRAVDMHRFAEGDRQEIGFAANKTHADELNERADRYEKQAKRLDSEAAELLPQIKKLEEEEQRIRDQMLEP